MTASRQPRAFAVIPAAGESRRMGRPKWSLPFRGTTVLQHVLHTWSASGLARVVVVVRAEDHALHACCAAYPVDVVLLPAATPDMKATVIAGLDYLEQQAVPESHDVWLLAPADMPLIKRETIQRLVAESSTRSSCLLVAAYQGRRGHPLLIPWPLGAEIRALGHDQGLRELIARHGVDFIECDDPHVLDDLDTPEDWERLRNA